LGGRLGIKSERNGPYLLIRGFIRLLNYEVTREELLKAEGMKIVWGEELWARSCQESRIRISGKVSLYSLSTKWS